MAGGDAARAARLQTLGYTVIRYTNADVHENLDGLLSDRFRTCEGLSNSPVGPSP